jgi:hypothetical protein
MSLPRILVVALFLALFPSAAVHAALEIGSAPKLVIAVAGSVASANGTFFRSEIEIHNRLDRAQRVRVEWLPRSGTGEPRTLDLTFSPANGNGIASDDFVAEKLHTTGLGSLVITALTDTGDEDPTAVLYARSRIWTPQPDTGGTTSQNFPAIAFHTIGNPTRVEMFGWRRDQQYRTNIGVVNLAHVPQRFKLSFVPEIGPLSRREIIEVELPPMSMTQFPAPAYAYPREGIAFNNTGAGEWLTYTSTVDNITGDSWSEFGVAPPQR